MRDYSCGLLLVALFAIMPFSAAQSPPLLGGVPTVLTDTVPNTPVLAGVERLYEGGDQLLTPEGVVSAPLADRWQPQPTDSIRWSWGRRGVWERFTLRNTSSRTDWLLSIESPLLAEVSLFQLDPTMRRVRSAHASTADLHEAAQLATDPGYSFSLKLAPGQETTILVRARSGAEVLLPSINIWETQAYQQQLDRRAVVMGLMFGALGIMTLYSAWLYFLMQDRCHGWLSLHLLSVGLYALAATGYGRLYLWGQPGWLNEPGWAVFACLPFLTATIFSCAALERQDTPSQWESRVLMTIGLLWVAAAVITAMAPPTPLLGSFTLFGILTLLSLLCSALRSALQGKTTAVCLSIAWITLIGGNVYMLLGLNGTVPLGDLALNAQWIGFLISAVVLSGGMVQRLDESQRRGVEQLVEQRLEVEELSRSLEHERGAKIFAQAHAVDVQRKCNELLESRVRQRTAALEQAIQQVEVENEELADLSSTDALTRVHNRRHFDLKLRQERAHFTRSYQPMSLLMVDIDKFKAINDQFGHPVGDEALRRVAAALLSATRAADTVARYGGEEFAVILPDASIAQAAIVAERMRKAIDRIDFWIGEQQVKLNVSIGAAATPAASTETPDSLIHRADSALLRAKQGGRNRVVEAGADDAI